jgi:hypothetical protein
MEKDLVLMDKVLMFPGTTPDDVPGAARPDIAGVLRDFADRADKGDFVSLVVVGVTPGANVVQGILTPWNRKVTLVGALVQAQNGILNEPAVPVDPGSSA